MGHDGFSYVLGALFVTNSYYLLLVWQTYWLEQVSQDNS